MHRDIKPANIMLTSSPLYRAASTTDGSTALLGDVGIARELDGSATMTQFTGSLVWADPMSRAAGDPE